MFAINPNETPDRCQREADVVLVCNGQPSATARIRQTDQSLIGFWYPYQLHYVRLHRFIT